MESHASAEMLNCEPKDEAKWNEIGEEDEDRDRVKWSGVIQLGVSRWSGVIQLGVSRWSGSSN